MRNCIKYPSGFIRKGYKKTEASIVIDTSKSAYPNETAIDELCLYISRGVNILGVTIDKSSGGTFLNTILYNTKYENDGISYDPNMIATNQVYYEIIPENQTLWHRSFFKYHKSTKVPLSFFNVTNIKSESDAKQLCSELPTCLGYQNNWLVGTNARFGKNPTPTISSKYYEKQTEHFIITFLQNNEYAIYIYITAVFAVIVFILVFEKNNIERKINYRYKPIITRSVAVLNKM